MCSALQQTHATKHIVVVATSASMVHKPSTDRSGVEKSLSSVVPTMPNSPQTPQDEDAKNKIFRFPRSRKGKVAIGVDILIVICMLVLVALIEFGVLPHHRSGFYCNDPNIAYKFQGDTVTMGLLLTSVSFGPLILIFLMEFRQSKQMVSETMKRLWYWYKEFLLGITVTLIITEFAKIAVGEPRPHFLDTCRPDTAMNCTEGYIPYYTCTNTQTRQWFVSDSSKSFPSGHSSLSVYSAVFCIWYMQRCFEDLSCKLVKPLIQTSFLVACTLCSLSRIADRRHHWWDVLAGAVLGFLCAIYTVVVFCQNFKRPTLAKPRTSHSTCTLLTDTTNKHATSVVL